VVPIQQKAGFMVCRVSLASDGIYIRKGLVYVMRITVLLPLLLMLCCLAAEHQPISAAENVKLDGKQLWIQVGNQIKDVDDAMLEKIVACGFDKVVLLHSSIDEKGYFPVLKSIVRRCHKKGIKVSLGTLVFKDTYQKAYWERHPDRRKCDKNGKYTEHKYYHYQICPNNPENHEHIARFLIRKAQEAKVDEIHIDYECTACYCPYCVKSFQDSYGRDARVIKETDRDWLTWRSRKTRDFFEVLARKNYLSHPDFRISATAPVLGIPGGFTVYGIDLRYDDLSLYVDEFVPMIYLSLKQDPALAGTHQAAIQRRLSGRNVIPGLILNEEFTATIKPGERLRAEIEAVYSQGARGLGLFEVRYLNEENMKVIKSL